MHVNELILPNSVAIEILKPRNLILPDRPLLILFQVVCEALFPCEVAVGGHHEREQFFVRNEGEQFGDRHLFELMHLLPHDHEAFQMFEIVVPVTTAFLDILEEVLEPGATENPAERSRPGLVAAHRFDAKNPILCDP